MTASLLTPEQLALELPRPAAASLSTSAMLVTFSRSLWGARRTDKDQTGQVTAQANASSSAVRVHKYLMPGEPLLADIVSVGNAAYAYHRARTMPWSDGGERLLPTTLYIDYVQRMSAFQTDFETAVDRFIDNYPAAVGRAQQALGKLYDPFDYPSEDIVRAAFKFTLAYAPVPDSGDFRLDVGEIAQQELRASYTKLLEERLGSARRDVEERLCDLLRNIVEQCSKEKTRVYNTLLSNVTGMEPLLEACAQLCGDPMLAKQFRAVIHSVGSVNVEDLRHPEHGAAARAEMAEIARGLLKQFEI